VSKSKTTTPPAPFHVFTQPWPAGPTANRHDQGIYYQYKADGGPPHPARRRRADRQNREGRPAGLGRSHADVGIPIYHRKRDSIEAHLTIVFAALAVSRWIENRTGWSIRKFIRTTRRYRPIEIQAGPRVITAVNPCPTTCGKSWDDIHRPAGSH
jgi:hypothetical protein